MKYIDDFIKEEEERCKEEMLDVYRQTLTVSSASDKEKELLYNKFKLRLDISFMMQNDLLARHY
jgi:hypothetical protein